MTGVGWPDKRFVGGSGGAGQAGVPSVSGGELLMIHPTTNSSDDGQEVG
jgi:hypothetical protein